MVRSEDGKSMQQIIAVQFAGMSLEQYLKKEMRFTKAQIRSMKFRENGLAVNGERVRVNYILKEHDLLKILLEEQEEASDQLEETDGNLEILYEDEDLIAVWKDAGIVVHPSHGHYKDTLSNRIYTYYKRQNMHVTVRSIGRLDKDTSGILIFAKNQVAAAKLWKQKEEGVFRKEYLAECRGNIVSDEVSKIPLDEAEKKWYMINAPIGAVPGELMKMCVTPLGKKAVTYFQIINYNEVTDRTMVRVRIDTGRMHQIRVHMAYIGYPLAGDAIYDFGLTGSGRDIVGEGSQQKEKQHSEMYLCAWKAELYQPFTGKKIIVSKATLDENI